VLANSHNVLNRLKNYFCQLLNPHRISNVRKMEIHAAEPLGSEPEVEIAITKLIRYKSPGTDKIPAELIQAGGKTLRSEIH
jgi:hypothetical protein